MATPSKKTIIDGFRDYLRHEGVDVEATAKEIKKALVKAEREGDPDIALDFVNEVLKAHGVEAIRGDSWDSYYGDAVALYVNMGDPYVTTLIYDVEDDRFRIMGYGDWIERQERSGRVFR